jgi:hypothetical protein
MAKAGLILGGLFALAALAWMAFLPAVVESELRAVTGFDVRVHVLAANPFTGRVVVRGLAARNPPTYPAPDFVQLRELQADVSIFSWVFTDRIVVDDLFVDVPKVEIVRRADGTSNLGEFAAAFSRPAGAPGAPGAAQGKPARYLIRKLRIRLEQLVIADYSGGRHDEAAYRLNMDHTFSDVSDPRQLLVPDVVRSLYTFGLRQDTAKLLPGDFGRALAEAVGGVAQVGGKLKDAEKKTGEYLKGLFDKLEQTAKP